METKMTVCHVCGAFLDGQDRQSSAYTVQHMGRTITVCLGCKYKPLCVANPDGIHGEVFATNDEEFNPADMLIGPLPEDRVFGYCRKCLLPWEWRSETMSWEPLTWQRLSYLWAERASGALDVDDREAVDVIVSKVHVPDEFVAFVINVTITLTLIEACSVCHGQGVMVDPDSFIGVRPCASHHGLRTWTIENTTPLAPDSELHQLAGAWGVKDGTDFDPEELQGFRCKVEVLNGAITRVLA